ncbi:hypothetical protein [Iamia sp.]|uniref:hypothetical protein n=1 Tax=Iamia sp. TaxID=2722710 RepID=UPI002CB5D4E7|nr:hypothetical protein [Iamia sp.]HXH57732.1 hypothetical protein [Iamia sp.]
MSDFAPTRTTYAETGPLWARDLLKAETHGVLISGDLMLTRYPDGVVPSGALIAVVSAAGANFGLGGAYGGTTDEVQTVTVGGAGLTSFTLTFSGQTTAAIAAAATAAQVQSALEALSNIGVGDVVVTGGAGGPWTVVFAGALADTDVAQMTPTPTGGTGTVTVATTTAGGADVTTGGLGRAAGHLVNETRMVAGGRYLLAVLHAGTVTRRLLPANSGMDDAAKVDLTAVVYI